MCLLVHMWTHFLGAHLVVVSLGMPMFSRTANADSARKWSYVHTPTRALGSCFTSQPALQFLLLWWSSGPSRHASSMFFRKGGGASVHLSVGLSATLICKVLSSLLPIFLSWVANLFFHLFVSFFIYLDGSPLPVIYIVTTLSHSGSGLFIVLMCFLMNRSF